MIYTEQIRCLRRTLVAAKHWVGHVAICVVLGTAPGVTSDEVGAQPLTIEFIGNAAFRISDGETTLYTDFPYESGYHGYDGYDMSSVSMSDTAYVVITHEHPDHFKAGLIEDKNWTFIGPERAINGLDNFDRLAPEKTRLAPDLVVSPIRTPHANLEHYSWLIEWDGIRMYFTGDTDDPTELLRLKDLDMAFVTTWVLSAARRNGGRVEAERIMIHHHSDRWPAGDCEPCTVPEQGEVFSIPEMDSPLHNR